MVAGTVTLLSSYKLNMTQIMAAMSRISREVDESHQIYSGLFTVGLRGYETSSFQEEYERLSPGWVMIETQRCQSAIYSFFLKPNQGWQN